MFATVVAGIDVAAKGRLDSPGMMVRWARAIASSWGFRFGTPAGNDFANLNISDWIGKALPFDDPVAIGEGVGHTCHLNACDYSGTLVSMTLTHGPLWFGGRWAIPASGVIMNAGIPVLAAAPPINSGGRLYAVTNMAPTVAHLRNGSAVAIGCPGARRIPTIIGIALVRHMLGGLTLQDAISAGRFHAEVLSRATVEKKRMSPTVLEAFSSGFLDVEDEGESLYYGPLTAICRGPSGELTFGLDDRLFKGASRELPCELG
jgi:gamma-glutamyltranspeptidase/glutathione hydrolase